MQDASYFKIGLFMLAAFVLTVLGAVAIGSGALGARPVLVETCFDESVQGLEVGSPVKYRGVRIGSVKSIDLASDLYAAQLGESEITRVGTYVVVTMSITSPSIIGSGERSLRENVAAALRLGLRMRLANLGLTGACYVEADYLDPQRAPPPLAIPWKPRAIYVPSAPGAFTRLLDTFERVADEVRKTDVAALLEHVDQALVAVRQSAERLDLGPVVEDARGVLGKLESVLGEPELQGLPKEVRELTASLKRASASLESVLGRVERALDGQPEGPLLADLSGAARALSEASRDLAPTLAELHGVLRRLDRTLASGEADVPQILASLRSLARSLEELAEKVRRYPGALFAEPPASTLEEEPRR